ncbi:MAG: LicD family protein [Candidatus Eremiobacterota bacterium]
MIGRRVLEAWRRVARSRALLGSRFEEVYRENLAEVFQVTNRVLREAGVDYWLVYGTLLGCYRQADLLPGDDDVDFGAHEREYARVWELRHRLPPGYSMRDTSYKHNGPKLLVERDGWKADIYFYREEDGMLRSLERSDHPGDVAPFPADYVFPTLSAELLGQPTRLPRDARSYLEHTYGYIGPDAVRDRRTGYWKRRA